ncbi:MAG: lysylphosphatidylglycerol synthase transmembrane domain-containing protein [Pseudomonadota bacterium]|nr:lysylphosphatidylglycerol synthase transmembrane domain-containing protein [Pseudomonadota bacterium]
MKRLLRLLPGLLVSLGFTLWFVLRAHWGEVAEAMQGVSVPLVLLSAAVLFTEFVIRTLRWKVLLRPFAPAARIWRLFIATVIGMSLNVVLPFRAGDIARPWLGARETGTPVLALVTIAVIERVFDILGLVSILVIMVLILPEDAQAHGELVTNLQLYGSIAGVAGVVGMAVFLTLAAREHAARHIFVRIVSIAPKPVADRFLYLFDGFVLGLESVRSRRALWQAGALSLLHWLNGSISIYVLFHAFGLDLPFAAACFTTVAIALTVALPQAPGFFGVFHVAIETTLVLWGLDPAPAQAFAIVFWAVSFVPVATVGAIAWWREGLSLGSLREQATPLEPVPGK